LLYLVAVKTIAAFLNSRDGGTLPIGVTDRDEIHGLDADYASRTKVTQDPRDWYQQHLANIDVTSMGEAAAPMSGPQSSKSTGTTSAGCRSIRAGSPLMPR
jgi:hypothetical protein